ncbi:MAG: hypothetical protein H6772_02090 [Pseudomonadales bacterium]|nr:hypothetical protein [Pseudomonadales bacterium]
MFNNIVKKRKWSKMHEQHSPAFREKVRKLAENTDSKELKELDTQVKDGEALHRLQRDAKGDPEYAQEQYEQYIRFLSDEDLLAEAQRNVGDTQKTDMIRAVLEARRSNSTPNEQTTAYVEGRNEDSK